MAQMVKNLPAVRETWVQSSEGPLKKETAAPSSALAWEIPCTEKPGGLQSMGSQGSDTTEQPTLTLPQMRKVGETWSLVPELEGKHQECGVPTGVGGGAASTFTPGPAAGLPSFDERRSWPGTSLQ